MGNLLKNLLKLLRKLRKRLPNLQSRPQNLGQPQAKLSKLLRQVNPNLVPPLARNPRLGPSLKPKLQPPNPHLLRKLLVPDPNRRPNVKTNRVATKKAMTCPISTRTTRVRKRKIDRL